MQSSISSEPVLATSSGLAVIFLLVLLLPFRVKKVEENLELFFLLMGLIAVTISGLWSCHLIGEALKSPVIIGGLPVGIFQVVLVAGLLLYYFNHVFYRFISSVTVKLGPANFIFLVVLVLGLVCSLISVIVASVILAEIVSACPYSREDKIKLTVIACFSMGLGAVLTPVGEPLSTILVSKLSGPPYQAGFLFPLNVFSIYIIPGVFAISIFGALCFGRRVKLQREEAEAEYRESVRGVVMRAVKVYVFISALVLLGEGLSPLIVWYFGKIGPAALYWMNTVSAVLDNATLTAVEIGPTLSLPQIRSAIIGLLIAGGMLIPGNIPNIVAAGRLGISMKEWAKLGLPLGFALMVIYFVILLLFP